MADVFDLKKRSEVMAAIRSRGNRDTELKLAAIFRTHGISGWRRHQNLPGRPDFVFRRERLAVFVDGCFWHGCPIHGRKPDSNRDYWLPKLLRNQARDRAVSRELRRRGWTVLRFWEHDLRNAVRIASRCRRALVRARAQRSCEAPRFAVNS
ncbi:MAG TPA: very short patch repair endonuclease, partial [Anaerolineales bacterium]